MQRIVTIYWTIIYASRFVKHDIRNHMEPEQHIFSSLNGASWLFICWKCFLVTSLLWLCCFFIRWKYILRNISITSLAEQSLGVHREIIFFLHSLHNLLQRMSGCKRGRQTDFVRYTKEGTERMRHKMEKKRDKVGGYLTLPQQYQTFCRTTSITQQSPCYPEVS
jgi:hypothetical protein